MMIRKINFDEFDKLENIWDFDTFPYTKTFKCQFLNHERQIYVLEKNKRFIAECDLVFSHNESGYTIENQRIYLSRLIVKREFRNQGLGQKLLEFVLNAAVRMHYSEITLGVDFDNAKAIHIYKKYGFEIFETAEDEQGVYFKMIKDLKDTGIVVEKMTAADFEDVYSLWISCKGMGLNDIDDTPKGIEKFLNRNPDTCFIAKINDITVGTILAGNDGRRGYIYHTAVSENYRKIGIASMLVDKVMQAFENIGISKASLVVFKENKQGNAFWQKQGFNERTDLIYRDKTIIKMNKFDT